MVKYLKTYKGLTTGSYMGRDDGYPTTYHQTFDSIEKLAKSYGKEKGEKYYELNELLPKEIECKVVEALQEEREKAVIQKKENLQNQIESLQKQLDSLK